MRHRKDLGARRHERIEYRRAGFIIPAPDAPWLECFIVDVSESGLCLDAGALVVPNIFGVSFTACGTVKRLCRLAWRKGELVGARYVTVKQLREWGSTVVPAKAGTHTPCRLVSALEQMPSINHQRQGLWVPAFAGTTTEFTTPSS